MSKNAKKAATTDRSPKIAPVTTATQTACALRYSWAATSSNLGI